MASIMEKRLSLHRRVEAEQDQNKSLKTQLVGLQHLANIGTVSHMIAHEMNNLLTPLKSYATFALNNPEDNVLAQKALQKTVQNCDRAHHIMESMLALVSGKRQERAEARLRDLVEEVFTCLCRDFTKDGITVNIQIPDDLVVCVVPVQIQQVFMNLILNARDAMLPHGGVLSIKAVEKTDSVEINITDSGDGINPDDLKSIFERFFTTKKDGGPAQDSGAGLGLAFCKMVIDGHGGNISVESEPGQGSRFKIELPKTTVG
ncbi:sensor histidine kinase [Planctomycetota bacterium]